MSRIQTLTAVTACALVVLCSPAWAGRPLRVDDANIDAKETGHVEAWFAREAGSANLFNVAPAYPPWEVVELSALLLRNRSDAITESSVLARVRIAEPQESGCNLLGALGQR